MRSNFLHHFPRITFRETEKYLWNPILKKAFKNLPEERVRLQLVEYLIEEAAFSKHRISFESPVNLPRDKSASRTDLICYDKSFNPILLVECKAPDIKLDEKAAIQIARYNAVVGAPLLLITNSVKDFWFESHNDKLTLLETAPDPFQSTTRTELTFSYWIERGFVGKDSHADIRSWLKEGCEDLYMQEDSAPRYFNFEGASTAFYLPNYYQVFNAGENARLALALTATEFASTRLNAVLNQDGENVALLSVSLDLLASQEPKNTIRQSASGMEHLDLNDTIGFHFDRPLVSYTAAFSDLMTRF